MLVILGGSAISCCILLYFSYMTSENEGWIDLVLLLGHLTVCSSIFLIRFVDSMKWPTRLVALLGALQLVVATAVSGGPDSIVLYALPVLPIFLSALVDIKTNIVASLIVLLGISAIFFADRTVYSFPEVTNNTWETLFALCWVTFMAMGIAVYSQHQANRLLKVAEEELKQRTLAQAELAQANESKDRFLAYMSHEIRNPLTAIVGATELLSMDETVSQHPRYLESLKNAANSLREIVDAVLDFSQIDSGRMSLKLSPLPIQPFLTDLISQFSATAEGSGVSLNCEIAPEVATTIIADKMRLRQVLSNLLSNAIKFSNPGGEVRLRATLNSEVPNGTMFVVEDDGIGIRLEDQVKIFEPYQRSREELGHQGTGLGLPIARALLEKMGATLELESELNQGSRFYFVMNAGAELPVEDGLSNQTNPKDLDGTSVLVAEDNPQASVVLLGSLEAMGCKVWHAKNGQETFELYKEILPQYVLMDIQMPVLNGIEATEKIREFEKLSEKEPCIILAITGEFNQEALTGSGGFNGLLQKPYSRSDLLQAISGRD